MTRTQTNVAAGVLGAATACLLIIGVSNAALLLIRLQQGEWVWVSMHFIVVCIVVVGLWQFHRAMSLVKQEAIRRGKYEEDQRPEGWCREVRVAIEDAPLAVAGYEVARLVDFALKTAHDDAFNRDVRNCVHLFEERCTREGGAV